MRWPSSRWREAYAEIEKSVRRIEQETGKPCRHFSYPYGDEASAGPREFELVKELGLRTGVTTRKGLIHPRHAQELTALPRVSLNGDYQKPRYVKVLLSGAPFALLQHDAEGLGRRLAGGLNGLGSSRGWLSDRPNQGNEHDR